MKTLAEIEARLSAIAVEIEKRNTELTENDITAFEEEVKKLQEERAIFVATQERRAALLASVATSAAGTTIESFNEHVAGSERRAAPKETDKFDTPEYRNAFMNYTCRNAPIPDEFNAMIQSELRANAVTTVADAGAVVPTTTLQEIIRKMESYGRIYAKVRKLNIKGNMRVPILTLKPTAKWIGEGSGDDQKIQADTYVEFGFYGIECKIAQTLLASIVTYEMFQQEFVKLATEAIVKALEKGIFVGTGNGQLKGITVDERVPAKNIIIMTEEEFKTWAGWKKKVFAKMKISYRNGTFAMAQGTFDGYIDGMVDIGGQPIGRVNYGIANGETYRFGGKSVETVEDDVIKGYDEAGTGDVVAVFFNPDDYAINSNMQMTVVAWTDHDDNFRKTKAILACDGKLLDPNGVLIIKKGSSTAAAS